MKNHDAYLELLGKVPLFWACTKKELKAVGSLCELVSVPSGKVLMEQGSVGYECYVIVSGQVSVAVDGTEIAQLGPGAYFGELALLDKGPRSATVTASADVECLVLGQRQFTTALRDVPGLNEQILLGLAARVREGNKRSSQA